MRKDPRGQRPGGGKPQKPDRPARKEPRRDGKPAAARADRSRGDDRPRQPRPPRQRPPRRKPERVPEGGAPTEPMRIAKAIARAGLCSRREAERWIAEGRVEVNGKVLGSPAVEVGPRDKIVVDGQPLPEAEGARLWRYHKPRGLVTTHRDPEGRPTVFDNLPRDLPRVISVGRLDYNTEGLLLLTNDGELARHMELPSTGWLRRYRVRAHGRVTQAALDALKQGISLEGVNYGPIEATLDSEQGANVWMTVGLREGKNREIRKIMSHLGLEVSRLIRVSFGPFQLLDLEPGQVDRIRRRTLREQLGPKIARELGLIEGTEPQEPRKVVPKARKPWRPETTARSDED